MPTIKIIGAYRFFFYSNEGEEPPHIHVMKERCSAKFWLRPVRLVNASGFKGTELRNLEKTVTINKTLFLEAWDAYFQG